MSERTNAVFEEQKYWRHVASILGGKLYGWDYLESAGIYGPDETQHATEIPAFVAKVLVDQDAECARLRKAIEAAQCSANCRSHLQRPFGEKARAVFDRSCNCWKSKALEEKP
jgi:hypothetical protein